VTAAAAWTIFGGDIFPAQDDPKGDPETWTREEMRRWLKAVRLPISSIKELIIKCRANLVLCF
jgi:hypothetical protein